MAKAHAQGAVFIRSSLGPFIRSSWSLSSCPARWVKVVVSPPPIVFMCHIYMCHPPRLSSRSTSHINPSSLSLLRLLSHHSLINTRLLSDRLLSRYSFSQPSIRPTAHMDGCQNMYGLESVAVDPTQHSPWLCQNMYGLESVPVELALLDAHAPPSPTCKATCADCFSSSPLTALSAP